jgi:2-polyprenyl-3-methyl-5-hydroxy-6-metoxy-1,4-benzoquinol methylase
MNYDSINRSSWEKQISHLIETEYKGKNLIYSLNPLEKKFTKHLRNKNILHLFCNFGMNTFSLENNLGNKCTGIDFSQTAIDFANKFKKLYDFDSEFICCDYRQFTKDIKYDVIFCSFGVLDWIENFDIFIDKIKSLLIDGGEFILVEFHTDYFKKIIEYYSGQYINENIYKITKTINEYSKSKKSILGKTQLNKIQIHFYTRLFNSQKFVDKIKQKMKIITYDEFDYINYPITDSDKKLRALTYRNETLESNQKMSFGLICKKIE